MAIFRPGPIASIISGTINGINFVNAKGSAIMRKVLIRRNQVSNKQISQRAKMQTITNAWRSLTVPDQQSWRTAAASFPRINRLGLPRFLSGFQLYLTYVLQHFDTLASFNIPCLQMSVAPPAGTWIFTCPHTTDWTAVVTGHGSQFTLFDKLFIARSITDSSRQIYHNYVFFDRIRASFPFTVIRDVPTSDPLLRDGTIGEKISFMVITNILQPDGLFLDSAPSFFEATIIP